MLPLGAVEICHLYISPGHNFVGHHGQEPDDYPMVEVAMVECVAGRGIRSFVFTARRNAGHAIGWIAPSHLARKNS